MTIIIQTRRSRGCRGHRGHLQPGHRGTAATFETEPRSADDIEAQARRSRRFPTLVAERWRHRARMGGAEQLPAPRLLRRHRRVLGVPGPARRAGAAWAASWSRRSSRPRASAATGSWSPGSFRSTPPAARSAGACGFREVGVYEKHGCLDGQWLDVVIVERLIPENLTSRGAAAPDTDIANEE